MSGCAEHYHTWHIPDEVLCARVYKTELAARRAIARLGPRSSDLKPFRMTTHVAAGGAEFGNGMGCEAPCRQKLCA